MHTDTHIIHDAPYPLPLAILLKLRKVVSPLNRPKLDKEIQEKLNGVEFSIFSNNCLAGYFYHDSGREFTSPTINLSFDGPDFIRFLERPQYYLDIEPKFIQTDKPFPVGLIDDVEINFVHYKTKQDALEA